MKFCGYCGTRLADENQPFCSNCGAKVNEPAQAQNQTQQNYYYEQPGMQEPFVPSEPAAELTMKWYNFLTKFALFAAAVIYVCFGYAYISGAIYEIQSDGEATAAIVYALFGSLKKIDVSYGVLMIAMAVYAIYTRSQLVHYKRIAPACVYGLYVLGIVISFVYAAAVYSVIGSGSFASTIAAAVGTVVVLLLNVKYFNKRKHLFVN